MLLQAQPELAELGEQERPATPRRSRRASREETSVRRAPYHRGRPCRVLLVRGVPAAPRAWFPSADFMSGSPRVAAVAEIVPALGRRKARHAGADGGPEFLPRPTARHPQDGLQLREAPLNRIQVGAVLREKTERRAPPDSDAPTDCPTRRRRRGAASVRARVRCRRGSSRHRSDRRRRRGP